MDVIIEKWGVISVDPSCLHIANCGSLAFSETQSARASPSTIPHPAKSKRGRQKGDGKKFVINCRKMSQNVL